MKFISKIFCIYMDHANMFMFFWKKEYTYVKPIHKNDFIMYSPQNPTTVNNHNAKIFNSLPREDAYVCLQTFILV